MLLAVLQICAGKITINGFVTLLVYAFCITVRNVITVFLNLIHLGFRFKLYYSFNFVVIRSEQQ